MSSAHALAAQARRLNSAAGAPPIPSLYFFTDPLRTPDPSAAAKRLPRGTAVVYRHFGDPDRATVARRLASIVRSRGLFLLVAADPELAARIGAAGVHWPESRLPALRDPRFSLQTTTAHSGEAIARASAFAADACVLAPVFETNSQSGNPPLGLFHASQMARGAHLPVIALGGVNARNASSLAGRGFAGIAAVEALTA